MMKGYSFCNLMTMIAATTVLVNVSGRFAAAFSSRSSFAGSQQRLVLATASRSYSRTTTTMKLQTAIVVSEHILRQTFFQ